MSSIRLGPCRARRLPCRLRTCRGRCRPLPGCLAFTPPRTEPDTIQLAPPKLNSTIEIRSRPDKQSADERLPSPRRAERATPLSRRSASRLAWFKSRLHLGVAGVDARRATPPGPRLPRWGLAGCRQLDPSHPALVTCEDAEVEPCLVLDGRKKGDVLNCCGKMPCLRKASLPGSCSSPEQLGMSPSRLTHSAPEVLNYSKSAGVSLQKRWQRFGGKQEIG